MPVMDGFEATRYIRKNMSAPKKDIPIIALTASVLNVDIRNCFAAGMNAYIPKPFKREDLIGTLAKFYSNPSAQNQLPSDPKLTLLKKDVNKPKPINGNITDMGFLNEFCDGDTSRMKKYIDIYVKGTPANLSKINVAIEDGDLQSLKLLIHTMKPQLGMMGMKRSEKWAGELVELVNSNESKESIHQLAWQIESDCKKSIVELS
jgi:CheY-like chemotaxis protein